MCESICDSEIKIYGGKLLPDREMSKQNITKISEVLHIGDGVRPTQHRLADASTRTRRRAVLFIRTKEGAN